jgi:hypothetical protein
MQDPYQSFILSYHSAVMVAATCKEDAMTLDKLCGALAAITAILIGVIMINSGRFGISDPLLLLWAITPMVVCIFFINRFHHRWVQRTAFLIQLLLCGSSLYIYYQVRVGEPDAEASLVFLFLPLYQYAALFFAGIGLLITDKVLEHYR